MQRKLKQAVDALTKGIRLNGYEIHVSKLTQGRFHEEKNIELNIANHQYEAVLLHAKVFYGRPPTYAPWVELFNIAEKLTFDDKSIAYFDSPFENLVLKYFIESLQPGARIFVEYYNDPETMKQLVMGVPAMLTRLGQKMFEHGCTWFKDWYFPEGYLEGNQKLQGEKPLNRQARERHLKEAKAEILGFIEKWREREDNDEYVQKALARARSFMTESRT